MTLASLLIRVQRWLMQPHVWRFAGFASTVVGLLCYALSSSFNHMFRDWNLWKICIYSVLSFIFCVAVLFAKVWQHSNSIRLKAHMAFLVLTVTSVYSFFFDKVVNEKPDAYSLISCAAFAVMSLSLSRQTHCGVELDLLYFFLGALIVQLMKIKFTFCIIGACFSYALIVIRSSLNASQQSGYLEVQDQNHVTVQVDSHSQEVIADIAVILPQLTACMEAFKANNWKLVHMLSVHVGKNMKAYGYGHGYDDHSTKDLTPIDNNLLVDALSQSGIIDDLSEVVKLMVAAGFEKECCDVYSSCRRECLEEILLRLRLLPYDSKDVVEMEGAFLEFQIQIWIKSSNIATRILFPNERRLCERVFSGFTSATDLAFVDVCREHMIRLLKCANSFAARSRSPKLFLGINKVLGTLLDLIPEFESLFSEPPSASLRDEAINTCKRLEKAIFTELKNWICHDRAMADFPGGLYPVSRDVMIYLGCVSGARILSEKVFHSISVQMAKIMELLERHLEFKSKNYTDPALHYLFMTNNGRYIEQKVREYKLETILGYDWTRKHTAKVQQNLEDYRRSSWDKVLGLLKLDRNQPIIAESMIKNLQLFNMQFKEICRIQSTWFVLDEETRKEIRNSLEKILWPAYGNFIERLQTIHGSLAYEYIEYSMYDIDALLNDLFRGSH